MKELNILEDLKHKSEKSLIQIQSHLIQKLRIDLMECILGRWSQKLTEALKILCEGNQKR